jgi:hypothetical protein
MLFGRELLSICLSARAAAIPEGTSRRAARLLHLLRPNLRHTCPSHWLDLATVGRPRLADLLVAFVTNRVQIGHCQS